MKPDLKRTVIESGDWQREHFQMAENRICSPFQVTDSIIVTQ
jgi:hypothetical protein